MESTQIKCTDTTSSSSSFGGSSRISDHHHHHLVTVVQVNQDIRPIAMKEDKEEESDSFVNNSNSKNKEERNPLAGPSSIQGDNNTNTTTTGDCQTVDAYLQKPPPTTSTTTTTNNGAQEEVIRRKNQSGNDTLAAAAATKISAPGENACTTQSKKLSAAERAAQRREERKARRIAAGIGVKARSTTEEGAASNEVENFTQITEKNVTTPAATSTAQSEGAVRPPPPSSVSLTDANTTRHNPPSNPPEPSIVTPTTIANTRSNRIQASRQRYEERMAAQKLEQNSDGTFTTPNRTRSGPSLMRPRPTTEQHRPGDGLAGGGGGGQASSPQRLSLPHTNGSAAPGDDLVAAMAAASAATSHSNQNNNSGDPTIPTAAVTPRTLTSRVRRPNPNSDNKTPNPGPEAYASTSSSGASRSPQNQSSSTSSPPLTTNTDTAEAIAAAAAAGLGMADYSEKQLQRRRSGTIRTTNATSGDNNSTNISTTTNGENAIPSNLRPGAYKEIPGRGLIRNDTLRFNLMEQVRESFQTRQEHMQYDNNNFLTGSVTSPRPSFGIHDLMNSGQNSKNILEIPSVLVEEDERHPFDISRNHNSWTEGDSSQRFMYDHSSNTSLPNARPIFLQDDEEEEDQKQQKAQESSSNSSGRRPPPRFFVPNPDRSFRASISSSADVSSRHIVPTAHVTPCLPRVAYATASSFDESDNTGGGSDDGSIVVLAVSANSSASENSRSMKGTNKPPRGINRSFNLSGKGNGSLARMRKKLGKNLGLSSFFRKRGKARGKTPKRAKSHVPPSTVTLQRPKATAIDLRTSQRRHSF